MKKIALVDFKDVDKYLVASCQKIYHIEALALENYNYNGSFVDKVLFCLANIFHNHAKLNKLNRIYGATLSGDYVAIIVKINKWQDLVNIRYSYVQIARIHVVFVVDTVPVGEREQFLKLINYIERFRKVFIYIKDDQAFATNNLFNVHFAEQKTLAEVLLLSSNNRRKYIGLKHHLNELRQKIKLHKDLCKCLFLLKLHKHKQQPANGETIPKVLHYCWFGRGPLPEKIKQCMASWEKILPEYTIKCWNEDNFPVEQYPFAKSALEQHKWAFAADVARLYALYNEGGIYLDTDVEVLKPLDDLLDEQCFTGYQSEKEFASAFMGCQKHNLWVWQMLFWYSCVNCDDDYTEIANTKVYSKLTKYIYGIKLNGKDVIVPGVLHVYPRDYFYPQLVSGRWQTTANTYGIHYYTTMW